MHEGDWVSECLLRFRVAHATMLLLAPRKSELRSAAQYGRVWRQCPTKSGHWQACPINEPAASFAYSEEDMRDYPLERRTIGHLLADKAEHNANAPWLMFREKSFTYADLHSVT